MAKFEAQGVQVLTGGGAAAEAVEMEGIARHTVVYVDTCAGQCQLMHRCLANEDSAHGAKCRHCRAVTSALAPVTKATIVTGLDARCRAAQPY